MNIFTYFSTLKGNVVSSGYRKRMEAEKAAQAKMDQAREENSYSEDFEPGKRRIFFPVFRKALKDATRDFKTRFEFCRNQIEREKAKRGYDFVMSIAEKARAQIIDMLDHQQGRLAARQAQDGVSRFDRNEHDDIQRYRDMLASFNHMSDTVDEEYDNAEPVVDEPVSAADALKKMSASSVKSRIPSEPDDVHEANVQADDISAKLDALLAALAERDSKIMDQEATIADLNASIKQQQQQMQQQIDNLMKTISEQSKKLAEPIVEQQSNQVMQQQDRYVWGHGHEENWVYDVKSFEDAGVNGKNAQDLAHAFNAKFKKDFGFDPWKLGTPVYSYKASTNTNQNGRSFPKIEVSFLSSDNARDCVELANRDPDTRLKPSATMSMKISDKGTGVFSPYISWARGEDLKHTNAGVQFMTKAYELSQSKDDKGYFLLTFGDKVGSYIKKSLDNASNTQYSDPVQNGQQTAVMPDAFNNAYNTPDAQYSEPIQNEQQTAVMPDVFSNAYNGSQSDSSSQNNVSMQDDLSSDMLNGAYDAPPPGPDDGSYADRNDDMDVSDDIDYESELPTPM